MNEPVVRSFFIGEMRIDFARGYGLPADHPHSSRPGRLPMYAFHVTLAGRSVLVDAVSYEPDSTPAHFLIPGYQPPPPLTDQLEGEGVLSEEITDLIISHAHFDHYSGLSRKVGERWQPSYPHARHYLSRADWHPGQFGALEDRTLKLVKEHGLLELVEGEIDLGDGLAILPYPGETAGHQIVRAQGEGRPQYFAGDLYHHAIEFEEPSLNVTWAIKAEMAASKRAFMARVAADEGDVHFSHIAGAFQVRRGENGALVWVADS